MSLKNLLVHLDPSDEGELRLDYSLRLASVHEASVTGLYVDSGLMFPALVDAPPSPVLVEHLDEERRARAEQAEALFERVTASADVSCHWCSDHGELVATLARHGHFADLIVVGQSSERDAKVVIGGLPDGVALSSGRPVLVVPSADAPNTFGERILIAWRRKREAVRAVHDALPLLEKAQEVDVVYVGAQGEADAEHVGAAQLCAHLISHGVAAKARTLAGGDVDVGDVLLAHAGECGHDMIVMGAYGHSRLREIVLGGTTRHVLRAMSVPVFMSH